MAARYVMRVEGVNFGSTIDDTQDLSTIRGGSLALLAIPEIVERTVADTEGVTNARLIVRGASLAALTFDGLPGAAEAARSRVVDALGKDGPKREPFGHLSFVIDVVDDHGRGDAALAAAQARNHARQFRQWTVALPRFAAEHTAVDALDGVRPADTTRHLPQGSTGLSASVAARRDYGRTMRQTFYDAHAPKAAERVKAAGLRYADEFRTLVRNPPEGLPDSVASHLALVYADGNRFGAIVEAVTAKVFSTRLVALQETLLESVLDWFLAGATGEDGTAFAAPASPGRDPALRIETLLWGGDELIFVMPAWLALPFIEGFFALTRDWAIGGHPLTFAVGAVLANHKAPVRQVRNLAKAVADAIKDGCDDAGLSVPGKPGVLPSAAGIEIFESLTVPEEDLTGYRNGLYRGRLYEKNLDPVQRDRDAKRLALQLAFPAEIIGDLRRTIGLAAEAGAEARLRRSQVYRLVCAARDIEDGLAGPDGSKEARRLLDDHRARLGDEGAVPRLPQLVGAPERPLGLELALMASFWDYADPFGGRLPEFGQPAQ